MSRNNNKKPIWPKFLIANIALGALAIGGYFGHKTYQIGQVKGVDDTFINKSFLEIADVLSDPDNCTAAFNGKNAISDFSITKLQLHGSDVFPIDAILPNTTITTKTYSLEATAAQVKQGYGFFKIKYVNPQREQEHTDYERVVNLYIESDAQDNITFCHALSSTFKNSPTDDKEEYRLRVIQVKAQGIQAQHSGVRTSIATAECPKGFQLTGCSGSVVGCEALGEAIKKAEPETMSPNTCEVRADATATCPIIAKAVAFCAKIIK